MMYYRGFGYLGSCFSRWGAPGSLMYGGGGFLMMAAGLLILALLVVAVIAIVKRSRRTAVASKEDESLSLLAQRFAKGELTAEEYEKMKKILQQK
ncbi:MAG: hypothetical protein PWQ08_357 [Clostridiales bacterium]|jgi:putative membrane protein|nr:SHOCT domain-containing protein [Pygmaiobacter sp.]MDK2813102.1 hypothetical protein [Clostridiales bacterium]